MASLATALVLSTYPIQALSIPSSQIKDSINYKVSQSQNKTEQNDDPLQNQNKTLKDNKNILNKILEEAKKNQTLAFGESHSTHEDNIFVISLLPELKELGYNDIGLEIDSFYQNLIDDYVSDNIKESDLLNSIPKIDVMLDVLNHAKKYGWIIHCIDETPPGASNTGRVTCQWGTDRNYKMFRNLEKRIFEIDPGRKVVVFVGDWHAAKRSNKYYVTGSLETPLAAFLDRHSKGRNYSILLRMIGPVNPDLYDLDLSSTTLYDKNSHL